jgi:hypothetical protein
MATPRGSEHRDLEQRVRDLERHVRELTGAALRRRQLGVDQGDFVVSGGGDVVVQDGGRVRVQDEAGNTIMDVGGAEGLRRPWIPYHIPIWDWQDTTSGTYTTLLAALGYSQHPFARVFVNARSASSTNGQFRVGFLSNAFNPGSAVWQPAVTIGTGNTGTGYSLLVPSEVRYGGAAAIHVQARRTSGTGTVGVSLSYAYGAGPE